MLIDNLTIKRAAKDGTSYLGSPAGGAVIMIGSTGGYDDGWLARITLSPGVHLQLFPKYGLVAMELANNGNTNLPACSCSTSELLHHLFFEVGETVHVKYVDGVEELSLPRSLVEERIRALKAVAFAYADEWRLSRGRDWAD